MKWKERREIEFEDTINRFSQFIEVHIKKFNPQKYGIEVDDIFQDVRIKIWNLFQSEKKINNYASYIKKTINSSVIDSIRKLKREKGIINQEKQRSISEQKNSYRAEFLEKKNIEEIIGQGIDSLIESRRKVVKLFLFGMNIEEIAICFKWSEDKTRNLLYRGLSDLRKILKAKGIEYENK